MKNSISLKKIGEKDFLVEKKVHSIDLSNPYENPIEKNQRLLKMLKVIINNPGKFTRLFLLILLTVLLSTFTP